MSSWPAWSQAVLLLAVIVALSLLSVVVVGRLLAEKSWWRAQNPAIRNRLASLPGGFVGIAIDLALIVVLHLHTG